MRTIVPFVLSPLVFGIFLCAQPPRPNPQIDLLEKKIADSRETVQDRITLINLYVDAHDLEGRRRQILWLTEHRPEISQFRNSGFSNPRFDMRPSNSMPDPVGGRAPTSRGRAQL